MATYNNKDDRHHTDNKKEKYQARRVEETWKPIKESPFTEQPYSNHKPRFLAVKMGYQKGKAVQKEEIKLKDRKNGHSI